MHFLLKYGDKVFSSQTKTMPNGWLESWTVKSDDPEKMRRSKDGANRVLSTGSSQLSSPPLRAAKEISLAHLAAFERNFEPVKVRLA